MSAQRLRDAAKVLRESVQGATPGPWEVSRKATEQSPSTALIRRRSDSSRMCWPSHASADGYHYDGEAEHNNADAAYIATMHPGVGLALAKWLDDIASGWMWDDPDAVSDLDGWPLSLEESMDSHAVAIADLILGGTP